MIAKHTKIVHVLKHYQLATGISENALAERIAGEAELSMPTVYNLLSGRNGRRRHRKTVEELERWFDSHRAEIMDAIRESMEVAV